MCNRCRLLSLKSSLDHAALVILPRLTRVPITEVDFRPCNMIAQMDECILHLFLDVGRESFTPGYVPICTDLNVHIWSLKRFVREAKSTYILS